MQYVKVTLKWDKVYSRSINYNAKCDSVVGKCVETS